MPQMHLYVPEDVAQEIRRRAKNKGISTSRYLEDLVAKEISFGWPKDFVEEVLGGWKGEPLKREYEGDFEKRSAL